MFRFINQVLGNKKIVYFFQKRVLPGCGPGLALGFHFIVSVAQDEVNMYEYLSVLTGSVKAQACEKLLLCSTIVQKKFKARFRSKCPI